MKALKIIGNIFGVLFSVILSLILVVLLIVMPIISAATAIVQPDTITDVLEEIDYAELIKSNREIAEGLAEVGVTGELMEEVFESDFVEDLIEVYLEDVFSSFDGNTESRLNAETLKDIAQDNMDELTSLFKKYAANIGAEGLPATDEEIKTSIEALVDQFGSVIIDALPSPEDLGIIPSGITAGSNARTAMPAETTQPTTETLPELIGDQPAGEPADDSMTMVLQVVNQLHKGTVMMILIAVIAGISLLIVLLRWPRFKGFMWLGVDYILAAAVAFLMVSYAGVAVELVKEILEIGTGFESLITPVISVLTVNLIKTAAIEVGLAIVFIAIFVVGRILLKKHKAKKAAL